MDLDEEHKNCLSELLKLPADTLDTFLRNIESYDSQSTENQKFYNALIKISIEQHKSRFSEKYIEIYLRNLLVDHQNCEAQISSITKFIVEKQNMFLDNRKRFIDLDWRLEAKVALRAMHELNSFEPEISIQIKTSQSDSSQNNSIFVKTNPSNLSHIIHKLEKALLDSKNIAKK